MASRMRRRCTADPTCPHPAEKGGRCTMHARQADADRNRRRTTSLEVYRSKRWRRVRRLVLMEHPGCSTEDCRRYATEVDHIVRIEAGGDPWDDSNLQALCKPCHSRKTALETGFGGRHE